MRLWASVVLVSAEVTGCYRSHQETGGPEPLVDSGFPTQSIVVLRQSAGRPSEPAEGARVLVEDCATGAQHEGTTDRAGVATVRDDGARCWNVTVVYGDEALSILGAPAPLPGPVTLTYDPEAGGDAVVPWALNLTDYEGGYVHADVPGTIGSLGARGFAARDAVTSESIATFVITGSEDTRGALVRLRSQADGTFLGEVSLPLDSSPTHTASIGVDIQPSTGYPWDNGPTTGRIANLVVRRATPRGALLAVGPLANVHWSGLQATLTWLDVPGTEGWSQPLGGGFDGPDRWRDACAHPIVSWSDVALDDGDDLRFRIPGISVREISGVTLETLRVRIGGSGHRSRMVLRTPAANPFEWTIEPFALDATEFVGLPALPAGVAERIGLARSSVYIQVGVVSPPASYARNDRRTPTLPYWIREGFVFGEPSDFEGDVGSCPVQGPR